MVKKTPDPESGSATLFSYNRFFSLQTLLDPGWIRPWSSWCRWCPPPCTGDPSRPPQLPRSKMMKNQSWKSQRINIHGVSLWISKDFSRLWLSKIFFCYSQSLQIKLHRVKNKWRQNLTNPPLSAVRASCQKTWTFVKIIVVTFASQKEIQIQWCLTREFSWTQIGIRSEWLKLEKKNYYVEKVSNFFVKSKC